VSDELKLIATALETVPTLKLMPYLKAYISVNPVDCFVVGEPRQMNNTPRILTGSLSHLLTGLPKNSLVSGLRGWMNGLLADRRQGNTGIRKKENGPP